MTCNLASIGLTSLWYKKCEYMNVRDLVKLSKIEIVCGLPILSKNDKLVYGLC